MLTLSCALAYTDIVATRSAFVTGTNAEEGQKLLSLYGGSPLRYRDNGRAIASVVFLWPGMVFTYASTYLLWRSLAHIDAYGPKSTHARTRDSVAKPVNEKTTSLADSATDATAAAQLGQTHAKDEGSHEGLEPANPQYSAV